MTSYTASTSNNTNTVRATAEDSEAEISISLENANGTGAVNNGSAVTWAAGENILTVTVTKDGGSMEYQVTVTKS